MFFVRLIPTGSVFLGVGKEDVMNRVPFGDTCDPQRFSGFGDQEVLSGSTPYSSPNRSITS